MVFQVAFAQVVDQQRQVQQVLLGQGAVDAPQRSRVRPKVRGELHRPQTMLVHRVLVVLIELQQAPGVMELGNESLQEVGVVQIAQQRAEPGRMAQQREEMAAGLRRRQGLRQLTGVPPDRLPRGGRDRLVVEIRQVHQPHDGRQIAAEQFEAAPRGQNARRPDVNPVLHPMAEQHGDQPGRAVARAGLGHKPRGHVAHGRGMAEVIPHELLDRQQAGLGLVAAKLGNAKLVGPIEHVGRLVGVEVQFVPQPQQELAGPLRSPGGPPR